MALLIIYLASQALNWFLIVLLLQKRAWREHPAFIVYATFNALHSILLFSLYGHHGAYLLAWEIGRPAVFALKMWICAEILREVLHGDNARKHNTVRGYPHHPCVDRSPVGGHLELTTATVTALRFAAFIPAPFLLSLNVSLERSLGFILAGLMGVLACSKKVLSPQSYAIVSGLFVISFLTAISALAKEMPFKSLLSFVPTISYTAALLIWIHTFRIPRDAR